MSDGQTGQGPAGSSSSDLSALRSRLAALHGSVERLGRGEEQPQPTAEERYVYPDQPAPAAYEGPVEPAYPPPPAPEQPAYDPYSPPPPPPAPADAYAYPPQPPLEPDPYAQPDAYEPAPAPYQPAPAATNGQGEAEAAATVAAHVAILDVGPFADLIELRHFEEAVGRLGIVLDVRVRRFGHGRAIVELGLDGPYAVGRELYRLGRPMRVEPGPDGEIVVDFTDVPDEPATVEQAAAETAEASGAAEARAAADESGADAGATGNEGV